MASSNPAEYDPHAHRDGEASLTNFEAFAHVAKSSLGVGIVAMPFAFRHAGYGGGTILSILCGIVLLHSMHILLNLMNVLCKRKHVAHLTYSEAMQASLENGPPFLRPLSTCASCIVYTLLIMYHFGISSVYVLFIAGSMRDIAYGTKIASLDFRFYILATALPLVIVFVALGLRPLMIFSIGADLLQIFALVVFVTYMIFHDDSKTKRHAFGSWTDISLHLGIVLFAVEALGIIIAIEEKTNNPQDYIKLFGIMNAGTGIVFLVNISIGFLGYWKYGKDVQGSFTYNLPKNDGIVQVTKGTFALSIAMTYALHDLVTVDLIWNLFKEFTAEHNYERYETTIRLFTTVISVFFAMALPKFSEALTLVGVFCLPFLGLVCPALMDIGVRYPKDYGCCGIYMVRDVFIILLGFTIEGLGTFSSVIRILDFLLAPDEDEY